MKETILIIDDDTALRDLLTEYLEGYGLSILCLPDGSQALPSILEHAPDLIILDVMMPGEDGFSVLGRIRAESRVPVVMLTAKGDDADTIVGLEMGADDYVSKPFNPRELLARIRAVLRRAGADDASDHTQEDVLHSGGLELDLTRRLLLVDEQELELSSTEFNLLKTFMSNPDSVMSRDDLMDKVWSREYTAFDRTIDVHVSRLRARLREFTGHEKRIKTVWGTGYVFVGAL